MGFSRYFVRQLWSTVLTVLIVVAINFIAIHLAPGDPVSIMGGLQNPSPAQIAYLQHYYGLDHPLYIQFLLYIRGLLHGNFGMSIAFDQPVSAIVAARLPATLLLTLTSAALAFLIGSALGSFTASRGRSRADIAVSIVCYLFYAVPAFWLGLMLILLFASRLHLLPTSGMVNVRQDYVGVAHVLDVMQHMVLPVGTLTLVQIPVYYRITRSSMTQVLKEDFLTTLLATGMRTSRIFRKYALKNAILPTVTIFGLSLGYVITGAALVEIVFGWPGIGQLTLNAVFQRDYPLLMGIYIMASVSIACMVLITDSIYAVLDPRIRYR